MFFEVLFLRYLPRPLSWCLDAASESFSAFSGGLWDAFSVLSLWCTAPKFRFFLVRGFVGCCWGFPGVFGRVFGALLGNLRGPTKVLFYYFLDNLRGTTKAFFYYYLLSVFEAVFLCYHNLACEV